MSEHRREQSRRADPAASAGAGSCAEHGEADLFDPCERQAHGRACRGATSGHALGTPADGKDWGVLYLGSAHAAKEKGPLVALDGKGEPLADQKGARAGLEGLIALDGNWAQAKALWWRNPWLTRLRRFVVVPDGPSLYGDLRREARPDAVSTLEAVGLALSALDGNPAVREKLLVPFRALLAKARADGVREIKRDRRVRR